MMAGLGGVRAVTFDVYGTLLDWEPEIAAFFAALPRRNGPAITDAELLAAYDAARRPIQAVRPILSYPDVLRRTFDDIVRMLDLSATAADREAFAGSAARHRAFADSAAALSKLRRAGLSVGALSNVDDASFAAVCARHRFDFDWAVTADKVGSYKPGIAGERDHFDAALDELAARGIAADRIVHVAQSRRADIVNCRRRRIRCIWVDRPGHVFGRVGDGAETAEPDVTVQSVADAADVILGDR